MPRKEWVTPPTVDEVLQEVEAYARARALREPTNPEDLREYLRDALSRAWCHGNEEGQPDYPWEDHPLMNPYVNRKEVVHDEREPQEEGFEDPQ